MVSFMHGLLVVIGYVVIGVFSLFYISIGIALARFASDLKLMAAPERADVLTEKFLQPEWDDLTKEEQDAAKKRLPIVIFGYICLWMAYIGGAYFCVKVFFPAIIQLVSNI